MEITVKQKKINRVIDFLTEHIYQIDNIIDENDNYQMWFGYLYDFLEEKGFEKDFYSITTDYLRNVTPNMLIVNVENLTQSLESLLSECSCKPEFKKQIKIDEIIQLQRQINKEKTKVLKRK